MIIGGLAVLALMILATGNVVLRIFHAPFRGTYEIVGFLGAVVIAFALGYTQKRKDHIVVDILTERFSKKDQPDPRCLQLSDHHDFFRHRCLADLCLGDEDLEVG